MFQIPAEIFPTKYRCTCHGISAAMGKLGSISVQLLLSRSEFTSNPAYLGNALGAFAGLMALGAFFAWAWLPDVQYGPVGPLRACTFPTLPSKTLEVLAKGRAHAVAPEGEGGEGQILGFRQKTTALFESALSIIQDILLRSQVVAVAVPDIELAQRNEGTDPNA